MLQPVAPEVFFDSPAGEAFKSYLQSAEEIMRDRGSYEQYRVHHSYDDYLNRIAHWQTANYDPATGLCTLYRGVDEARKEAFLATGAITSRAVEIFGNNDVGTAIDVLRGSAAGHIPDTVMDRLRLEQREARAAINSINSRDTVYRSQLESWFSEVTGFIARRPKPSTQVKLLATAALLETTLGPKEDAYLAASREAAQDEVPRLSNGISMEGLLHTSIHTTTRLDYVYGPDKNHSARAVLKIMFKPGSLPVAPDYGYVGGKYVTTGMRRGGAMDDREEEWYGVGQLASGPDVTISVLE